MKKWIVNLLLLAAVIAANVMPAFAADVRVTIDGVPIQFTDAHPYIDQNGRTMIPLRAVGEALGYEIEWLAEDEIAHLYRYVQEPLSPATDWERQLAAKYPNLQTVSYEDVFLKNNRWEICWMLQSALVSNGKPIPEVSITSGEMTYTMDTLTTVQDGRTYIPLRALVGVLSEPIGIAWDNATQTVRLTHTTIKPNDDSWYDMEPRHEAIYWLPDDLELPSVL